MIKHAEISQDELRRSIDSGSITLGGYGPGKIYGTLACRSGKRMRRENRVFFADKAEALALGFRPCGNCMRNAYLDWKASASK